MNYHKILNSMKAYREDNGGTITLTEWKENASKDDSTTYELDDATTRFLSAIRPTASWIELDV